MSSTEELRMEARKRALSVAKTFGWPLGGREYQDEFDQILENLIKEKIKQEKDVVGRDIMSNIYTSLCVCKSLEPIGMLGYNNVVLGLSMGSWYSDIFINGTCSRFEVGKEYIVTIVEK